MSAYETSYDRWNDAIQAFDYYVVGVLGGGIIFLIKDLKIEHVGLNSDTITAFGVFILIVACISGLSRLEQQHMRLRFENEKIKITDYRNRIKDNPAEIFRESHQKLTPEEVKEWANKLDSDFILVRKALKNSGDKAARLYSIRNWSLISGLIILFAAKLIDPLLK